MITIVFFFIGVALGAMQAKKRKGDRLDIAQYGAIYGLIFAVIGLFVTIFIGRMA